MKSSGLATILLLIPVLAVPALAIFGIPQFAPVVASPLAEGIDNDREKRVGKSARQSHDELFDDIDGVGSESIAQAAAPPTGGNAIPLGNRSRRRNSTEDNTPSWGDDLKGSAGETPRDSSRSFGGLADRGSNERPNPDDAMALQNLDQVPRYQRKPRSQSQGRNQSPPTTPDELDGAVRQIGHSEEAPADEKLQEPATPGTRSRSNPSRSAKPRELPTEDLTWGAAVERLNELDIRNFRLEPGPQSGTFIFICTYTAPDAPAVSYRFEAEADQPLKAVSKVLEQIVEWRQRR